MITQTTSPGARPCSSAQRAYRLHLSASARYDKHPRSPSRAYVVPNSSARSSIKAGRITDEFEETDAVFSSARTQAFRGALLLSSLPAGISVLVLRHRRMIH